MESSSSGKSHSFVWNAVEQWTTQTFLITQGSGILAVILHQLDWQFNGSQIISTIVWVFTIVIFILFLLVYLIKAFMFPRLVRQQLDTDIVELCCLASISITLGVVTDMVALVCAKDWGPSWAMVAYVLTWIDVALAIMSNVGIPYQYFATEHPGIDGMPPNAVLPSIAAVTCAATCGTVAFAGDLSARAQVPLILVGYIVLGIGLPYSFIITAEYITYLLRNGLPPRGQSWMVWTLAGPLGQAAYACQILGSAAASPGHQVFANYDRGTFITASSGQVINAASALAGLVIWGYATFWALFSLIATIHLEFCTQGGIRNSKYSLSVWSPVFPMGVYALGTLQFGKDMNSPAWSALSSGDIQAELNWEVAIYR
ncbi:hypothetical protein ACLMJK_000912 [Lecanora helva]